MYVSALFIDGKYDLHWEYTAATNPYITLTVDSRSCKSKCDKDVLCNGYSIDTSNSGCFLSKCTTPTSVPTCPTCLFASKNPTSSEDVCPPVLPTTTMTTTTPMIITTPTASLHVANDVTPIIINNTICYCVCTEVNQTLQESIDKRRTKLSINKPELSSNIRKLYSVPDYRMSSKVIGSVAIIVLVVAGMLLIVADLSSVLSLYSKRK